MPTPARAYYFQRRAAEARGIAFNLTFEQWLSIWVESGHFEKRGRGAGKYVMSRRGDEGAYEVGNVFIQPFAANVGESSARHKRKHPALRGAYLLYPGSAKPWLARVAKVRLGFFATQDEALAARAAFLQGRTAHQITGRA